MGFHRVINPKGKPKHKWLKQAPSILIYSTKLLYWTIQRHSLFLFYCYGGIFPTAYLSLARSSLTTHCLLSTHLQQQTIDPLESLSASRPSISQICGNNCSTLSFSHHFVPSDAWIIDTGTTYHFCCNISLFSYSTLIHNTIVTLPNGHVVAINRVGSVKLSNTLSLDNVLFVPMFTFNLLNISVFTLSHNCSDNFLLNSCVIQDLTWDLTIGKSRIWNNLYFLELGNEFSNFVFANSIVLKRDIWHFCLGHPSHVKIQFLHNELHIPSFLSHLSSHHKICHMAKQTCLSFVSHNNMYANPFNLVHIDIWGPFHVSTPVEHRYFLTIIDDCTQTTWVYILCAKADVLTIF